MFEFLTNFFLKKDPHQEYLEKLNTYYRKGPPIAAFKDYYSIGRANLGTAPIKELIEFDIELVSLIDSEIHFNQESIGYISKFLASFCKSSENYNNLTKFGKEKIDLMFASENFSMKRAVKDSGCPDISIGENKTNQLILNLEAQNKTVKLSIKNEMNQDCYISEASIMLDGFMNDKFQISNEASESAIYQGIMAKYYPQYILIKAGETITNELDLSEEYLFPSIGKYSVIYHTHIDCCDDSAKKNCHDSKMIIANATTIISQTIDEADVFKAIYHTYEYHSGEESLNLVWYAILSENKYWHYLLQSSIFNKMSSRSISDLLSLPYQMEDNDIPLGYIVKNYEINDLEVFLESKIFSRLNEHHRYELYSFRNNYSKSILDLAIKKSFEHFELLLNCNNCFVRLDDEHKLDLIESDTSPILHTAFYVNSDFAKFILDNEILANMETEYKTKMIHHLLHYQTGIIGPQPNPFITDDSGNLNILKSSKVFSSLDQYTQNKLLFGEVTEGSGVEYDL